MPPRFLAAAVAPILVLALSAVLPRAAAQEAWAVQTAAFRDLREAGGVVAELQGLGYDAYSEFTMHQGKQYSRVRVGCFLSRPLADDMAAELRGRVTAEAVVVPYTPGAPARACIAGDIGFELPERWGVLDNEPAGILFWVELFGRRGYVGYDGARWRVAQSEQEATRLRAAGTADGPAVGLPTDFAQGPGGAITAEMDGRAFTIAFGELLWQTRRTAVVLTGDRITALGLVPSRD